MSDTPRPFNAVARVGLGLVLLSCLLWLLLACVPLLPMSGAKKALWASVVFLAAEITFWLGAALAGKEVVQRYWERLHPKNLWKRRRTKQNPSAEETDLSR